MASRAKRSSPNNFQSLVTGLGIGLILFAGYILVRLFADPVRQEITYAAQKIKKTEPLPPNTDFAIVIPKLAATAPIIAGVDPYDSRAYQVALSQGIAQAKGTRRPGEGGNIFLFAHSSADLLTAERYNSVFYLLHHLDSGDVVYVWYQSVRYTYEVVSKQIAPATAVQYMRNTEDEQLTLMTCYPPGTTFKRLIIIAKRRL